MGQQLQCPLTPGTQLWTSESITHFRVIRCYGDEHVLHQNSPCWLKRAMEVWSSAKQTGRAEYEWLMRNHSKWWNSLGGSFISSQLEMEKIHGLIRLMPPTKSHHHNSGEGMTLKYAKCMIRSHKCQSTISQHFSQPTHCNSRAVLATEWLVYLQY